MNNVNMKKPNILLIVMDSARAANFSCYGYSRPTTPNLDKFAQDGVLFEQAIAEGCWSLPVHTSLFTGVYPLCHGITTSKDALPDGYPTLARMLKDNGYYTCCFTNNAYVSSHYGLIQGFEKVDEVWRAMQKRGVERPLGLRMIKQLEKRDRLARSLIQGIKLVRRLKKMFRQKQRLTDSGAKLTNERIQKWMNEEWDRSRPFFMFVNFMEVHEKYDPPHPFDRRFMPSWYSPRRVAKVSPNKSEVLSGRNKRRKEDLEILQALYDGEMNYLDHRLGELFQFLKSKGIQDETLIVVTADHGEGLGEHDHLGHRKALFEELVHVPLLIRYPRLFPAGSRVPYQVQLADLVPTFLDIAGVSVDKSRMNGFQSLRALPQQEIRPFTVAENTAIKSLDGVVARMIRTRTHKYIWKSSEQHELYDLVNDPGETKNVSGEQPEIARHLHAQLEEWQRAHAGQQTEKRESDADEVVEERLRALGYMS